MTDKLLQQLRDIHYPAPISFWPLAVGWYAVIVLMVITLGLAFYYGFKNYRKKLVKRLVLRRLQEIEAQRNSQNHEVSEELSMLLKRAALAKYPRHKVAGLHGEKWLNFLDKTATTKEFAKGCGRLLLNTPYQGKNQLLPETLFHLIRDWVKKNL